MKKELANELEPMNLETPKFWEEAVISLAEHPTMVLPVFVKEPLAEPPESNCFLRLVREDGKIFVQIEGFSSLDFKRSFEEFKASDWIKLQPGIYRTDMTDILRGLV